MTEKKSLGGAEKLTGNWKYFQVTENWQQVEVTNFVFDGDYRMQAKEDKYALLCDVLSVNGTPCTNPIKQKQEPKEWEVSSARLKKLLMPIFDKAYKEDKAKVTLKVKKIVVDPQVQTKNTYEVEELS
jgi:hypothetical protein